MEIAQVWQRGPEIDWSQVLLREPAEEYHARAQEYLSSHQLAAFRECPKLFQRIRLGLMGDQDRPAYLLGRAGHTWILEGREAFDSQYAVGGPINPKTQQPYGTGTKAWSEWAEATGKQVLTAEQANTVAQMFASVRGHDLASTLLSHGQPEAVVRHPYRDIPCQIRMDWFNPARGIVDLKTSDNLTWFEPDARRYRYLHQLAFYRSVLAEATGALFDVFLIAVEKREPFRCGVWRIASDVLSYAATENDEAIDRLRRCQEFDYWPTGYEELREFDYL